MGTLTRAQHHIGLRLMLTIALWGHSLEPTSHWVEANVDNSSMGTLTRAQHHIGLRLMLTIALWGHSLEPNITLG